ncbi:integrase [Raoultella ornithinolytica]
MKIYSDSPPLRKALILNGITLIAIIVLSALGIWLVNELVAA